MKLIIQILIVIILLFSVIACNNNSEKNSKKSKITADSIYTPKYAKKFNIEYFPNHRVLNIFGDSINGKLLGSFSIFPDSITTFASMSQTLVSFADVIDKENNLCGIADASYVSDTSLLEKLNSKSVIEIGKNNQLMLEELISIHPAILFVSIYNPTSYASLESVGIKVIPFFDYLENHPLGRTEWIMALATVFNKDIFAKNWFQDVCEIYENSCEIVLKKEKRPTVFDASEYSGVWYVSGGKSFMTQFYNDAGADYIWAENSSSSSIPLDYESVYVNASDADFWRIYIFSDINYNELLQQHPRMKNFRAFSNHNIIVCNSVSTNYHTKSITKPEIVLKDFIKIFHPELLPNYKPFFFRVLK